MAAAYWTGADLLLPPLLLLPLLLPLPLPPSRLLLLLLLLLVSHLEPRALLLVLHRHARRAEGSRWSLFSLNDSAGFVHGVCHV